MPLGRVKDFKWGLLVISLLNIVCFLKTKMRTQGQKKSAERESEVIISPQWIETSSDFCDPDGHKPTEQDYLRDKQAKDLRAMSLLNNGARSRSITVNLQSIR